MHKYLKTYVLICIECRNWDNQNISKYQYNKYKMIYLDYKYLDDNLIVVLIITHSF